MQKAIGNRLIVNANRAEKPTALLCCNLSSTKLAGMGESMGCRGVPDTEKATDGEKLSCPQLHSQREASSEINSHGAGIVWKFWGWSVDVRLLSIPRAKCKVPQEPTSPRPSEGHGDLTSTHMESQSSSMSVGPSLLTHAFSSFPVSLPPALTVFNTKDCVEWKI